MRGSPVRFSVVIAAHNEGSLLWRTVASCLESAGSATWEIVVVDDASQDDSIARLEEGLARFRGRGGRKVVPVRILRSGRRRGVAPSKDRGARHARGRTLIFLDAHCRPQRGALERLSADVAATHGCAVVSPRIPHLDTEDWTFETVCVGYGFAMDLRTFDCAWLGREHLDRVGRFYESPALIGCCAAVRRDLYEKLRGFDRDMRQWGLEDIDFGLKAWLSGHPVLVDARVAIAHRFRVSFDTFSVDEAVVLANKMRMARKNFTDPVWAEWLDAARAHVDPGVWEAAARIFEERRPSVERERRHLMRRRVRDEFAYARRFDLSWPAAGRAPARQ